MSSRGDTIRERGRTIEGGGDLTIIEAKEDGREISAAEKVRTIAITTAGTESTVSVTQLTIRGKGEGTNETKGTIGEREGMIETKGRTFGGEVSEATSGGVVLGTEVMTTVEVRGAWQGITLMRETRMKATEVTSVRTSLFIEKATEMIMQNITPMNDAMGMTVHLDAMETGTITTTRAAVFPRAECLLGEKWTTTLAGTWADRGTTLVVRGSTLAGGTTITPWSVGEEVPCPPTSGGLVVVGERKGGIQGTGVTTGGRSLLVAE